MTHSELAEMLHVQPATMTNTLKRMEKAGFVERRHDAADQRVSRVYLTDAGYNIQEAVKNVWDKFEEQAFASLDVSEAAAFRQSLIHVRDNLM